MNNSTIVFASITKKITMGLAGLFLLIFLVVHLTVNLFLLKGDGGETFNTLAHFMASNPAIKIMEYVLIAAILIHIFYGVVLQIQNWSARGPVRYKVRSKANNYTFSRFMIYTGIILGIFFVIHFIDFWFKRLEIVENTIIDTNTGGPDFYIISKELFINPYYSTLYIILIIIAGFHLYHALQSGFQTLGLSHSKYTPFIKYFSSIYSIVITVGFCIIPLYFLFIFKG